MMYKVFTNSIHGRTIVDVWDPADNKTISDLALIYDANFVKIDEYTNEGQFVTSVYLAPNDKGEMVPTNAGRTFLVGEKF